MRRKKTTRVPVNRRSFVTVARIFASKVRTVLSVEGGLREGVDFRDRARDLAATEAGYLAETATFDAKTALPARDKSRNLAVDVL
jgi:hypothetical protein